MSAIDLREVERLLANWLKQRPPGAPWPLESLPEWSVSDRLSIAAVNALPDLLREVKGGREEVERLKGALAGTDAVLRDVNAANTRLTEAIREALPRLYDAGRLLDSAKELRDGGQVAAQAKEAEARKLVGLTVAKLRTAPASDNTALRQPPPPTDGGARK